jgi:hypothetical protein
MFPQYSQQYYKSIPNGEITGQLSIVSIPSGADIFIDGIKQSDPTPSIMTFSTGQHIYRLICPGYIDEDGMVFIQEGQTYDLFVTMHKSFDIKDELIYGFIGSLAAGIALYLLVRRKDINA